MMFSNEVSMKVHEFQAKELLARYGIPTPRGRATHSIDEAAAIAKDIAGPVAVKAQIHAGGRGKGGGIKIAKTPGEARKVAGEILGMTLVTHQTGPQGKLVKRVLVEEQLDVARELYVSVVIDNSIGLPIVMASAEGGVEIEEVAARNPEAIKRSPVDPTVGFEPFQGRELALAIGLGGDLMRPAAGLFAGLYKLFEENDCSLAEINPLVVTKDGRLLAADAKLNFDDNALYRHKEIAEMRDFDEEDPLEVRANESGIGTYIKLTGNIGCVVNGAGLAMATMDAITLAGGEPANFLDIGTVNDPERVIASFRILMDDPDVKAVLINIFGGMARVDIIAQGIIDAHKEMDIHVPIVARLVGTNVEEGERLLAESGVKLIRAQDLGEAAKKAVEAAAGKAAK
jgi:succinyl-CoA synthetase beta subunit